MSTFPEQEFLGKNNKPLVLRSIRASDVKTVKEFVLQIATETTHTMKYVGRELPTDEQYVLRYEAADNDPKTLHLGAFDSDRLVAYLSIRPSDPDHPWVKHIAVFGMSILKEYWGLGIGAQLLRLQDQFAVNAGFLRIEAKVRTLNDRGIQLYKRMGYSIEGTRRAAAIIDSEVVDEFYIAKLLNQISPAPKPTRIDVGN